MTAYYVRTDGNDANTGLSNTAGGAFLTIKKGISVIIASDILNVNAGTYKEGVASNLDTMNSGNSFSDAPIIQALGAVTWKSPTNGEALVVWNRSYIIINDFIFDGIDDTTSDAGRMLAAANNGSHHIRWNRDTFQNAGGNNGGMGKGGSTGVPHHNEWLNCIFKNNRRLSATSQIHGFYTTFGDDSVWTNCQFFGNQGYGIQFFDSANSANRNIISKSIFHNNAQEGLTSAAFIIGSGVGNAVYNSLIYDEPALGGQIGAFAPDDTRIYNCTFVECGRTSTDNVIQVSSGTNAKIKNCIMYSNFNNAVQDLGTGTVQTTNSNDGTNPNFVNFAGRDLHLTAATPAGIKTGGATLTEFSDDFDGLSRPQGSAWGIGAYEFPVATSAAVKHRRGHAFHTPKTPYRRTYVFMS